MLVVGAQVVQAIQGDQLDAVLGFFDDQINKARGER
jgi:hypothetical protein